jgi:tRNA modification GTPase
MVFGVREQLLAIHHRNPAFILFRTAVQADLIIPASKRCQFAPIRVNSRMKFSTWNDTIVALATPPGIGAIGVIRLSGENAFDIVGQLFLSKNLAEQPSHTLHVGLLKDEKGAIDEVVVSLYKAPRSYTGENVIEISSHGSPYVIEQIIEACHRRGARLARAGEFTMRAFLNGKLDLTQAEAVADLIASNTEASKKAALNSIRGGFSNILKVLRERLIQFSALIELELDFSQEDVEFADRTQFYQLITQIQNTTTQLLQSFSLGNVIKNGVQVAIVGKPNSGKSTLLNTLLNENRAIVSEIAGTTRDTIEEQLNIEGIIFRLIDTAGIREHISDSIEKIGVERSREKIRQADLVVYLFDLNTESAEDLENVVTEFEAENIKYILVGNKADLLKPGEVPSNKSSGQAQDIKPDHIRLSAKENRNIDQLKKKLVDLVLEGNVQVEDTVVTNVRHYQALQELSQTLHDIRQGLDNKVPTDLIALDIRRGLHYLGEITGEITTEDQLDYIFSKFCIGK